MSLQQRAAPAGFAIAETLRAHARILCALMVRDVQTRFFGSPLGFAIAIGFPLSHIFILLIVNSALGRTSPYGDSSALFFATGLTPYMCFNYMTRYTMLGLLMNKPLLGYPVVKVGDILFARAIVEVFNATLVVIATLIILTAMGVDVRPPRPLEAMYAMMASMWLGLGIGTVNGVITGLFSPWGTAFSMFQTVMWMASGVVFVPDELPETVRYWLSYNPALIGVEWMRSAYYDGIGLGELLDKPYMLGFATTSVFLGLLLERSMRGRILR